MATTPPKSTVPDTTKFAALIVLADKIPEFAREMVDAIKQPDGTAVAKYNDLHTFALELKKLVNGLYKSASEADVSLQKGKRKEKKAQKDNAAKPNTKDGIEHEARKADNRATFAREKRERRGRSEHNAEPEMTGPSSDSPDV